MCFLQVSQITSKPIYLGKKKIKKIKKTNPNSQPPTPCHIRQ